MNVQAENYEQMRTWFARMSREVFPAQLISEADPLAHLDELEQRSATKAWQGLTMAINDLVELTDGWPAEKVRTVDAELLREGLPTLTEIRTRFSSTVQRAVRRGRIQDEVEYHAVRNAADVAGRDSGSLWSLLAAYEENAAR